LEFVLETLAHPLASFLAHVRFDLGEGTHGLLGLVHGPLGWSKRGAIFMASPPTISRWQCPDAPGIRQQCNFFLDQFHNSSMFRRHMTRLETMRTNQGETRRRFHIDIGSERIVLADGLQPFLFRSRRGTIFLQAQLSTPLGYVKTKEHHTVNDYPCGNVISRDNGKTWKRWRPKEWEQRQPYFEGECTQLRDGTILMLEWVAVLGRKRGVFEGRLWESKDELETLRLSRCHVHLPQAKTRGYDDGGLPYQGITFHRSLLELPGGDLLATNYCWFKGDDTPCPYMPKMWKFRTVLLRSTDRGRNWSYVSTIAADPRVGEEGFNENVMVRLSKGPRAGRLICLIRTGCHDCPIYQTVSDDEGATWAKARPLWIHGVDPDLIEMSDGTLVCSFGWRTKNWYKPKPPSKLGNYLVFSRDQGETWTNLTRLAIEPHANTPWTTCYTTVREIAPRQLLVVYDIGRWGMPVRYIGSREIRL
jgi:hypothetical protein